MYLFQIMITLLLSSVSVTITQPEDGMTYDGDWLMLKAIVENNNEIPDSVSYVLNGEPAEQVQRLNTDWYTYMQNDLHHGYSESPGPTDNTILWTAHVTGDYHEFPSPVVVDGLVYYPQDSSGDSLYALDAATGEIIWKYYTGYTDDAVTVKNGYLYTASDSLWCLDAATGDRIWARGVANAEGSTPAVVDSCVYCGTGTFSPMESQVYSLDAYTGETNWSVSLSGYTASCLTVWNGMLFIPTWYGPLYALDAGTGAILWVNYDSDQGYWDSSPVIVDGMLYILCDDRWARAINPLTGLTEWQTSVTPGVYLSATPAYYDGRLYFGDQVDSYHCLDALDGSFEWSVPGVQHGSTGIADGIVYYGEGSNYYDEVAHVYALDADNGQVIWSYETTSGPFGIVSSPSITDGVMYIAGTDWNLYAFGTGLKYTYREEYFYADIGSNELIVTSFDDGLTMAADTINFTVTQEGIMIAPQNRLELMVRPNPFRSQTSISFSLTEASEASVSVFDLAGRMIMMIENAELGQGQHTLYWDGKDSAGRSVPPGMYICRIQAGRINESTGLCILR